MTYTLFLTGIFLTPGQRGPSQEISPAQTFYILNSPESAARKRSQKAPPESAARKRRQKAPPESVARKRRQKAQLEIPLDKNSAFSYPLSMNLPVDSIDLDAYSEAERIALLNRLQVTLPIATGELNLEAEIVMQLHLAKAMQSTAQSSSAPLNQKAQVANTITAILRQLVDMQAILNTTETIKKIERVLLETLNEFPKLQELFLERYSDNLTP